jgi:putative chitinase
MSINRKFFFDHVRLSLFGGKLSPSQVSGLTAILDAWEKNHWNKDDRWLAYALGTQHHECDRTCQPITEYGPDSYFKKYDGRDDLGNTDKGDGLRFKGRGYVQLTGRRNYTLMSAVVGENLINDPSLALRPDVASQIMFYGMMNGSFTGKKLSDYFNETKEDWIRARRIINGLDKANTIGSYSQRYYAAVSYTI